MKPPVNYVAIEFDKSRDDTFTTEGGLTLYVPTLAQDRYDPRTETDVDSIRTWGKVVGTPYKTNKNMLIPVSKKVGNKEMSRTAADIVPEVRVGDIIHFRYTVMETPENRVVTEEGTIVLVPYSDIFGIEKEDGSIHPIGSYVFIEPLFDKIIESALIIIPEEFNKQETPKGRVLYIGTPFMDEEPIGVKPGDVVLYNKSWGERHKLRNDTWVEVIYQDDIHAIIES